MSSLPPSLVLFTGVVGALAVTGASRAAPASAFGRAEEPLLAAPARLPPSPVFFGEAGRRDPVVERDIFGAAAARISPAGVARAQDETRLILSTTVVDPDGGFAVAWLGHGTDRLTAVSVGDSVDGGVVVEIGTREVLLERGNGLLTRVVMQGPAPTSAHPSRPARGSTSDRTAPQSGYRLAGLARGDLLFDHGLRDGDVLHTVAGVAVASRQSARLAVETARRVGAVDVDLTRDGRRLTLSLLLP